MKTGKRKPYGVCRTFFFNACDRVERKASKRRPCFVAYHGHGKTYKTRRFPIDTMGVRKAYRAALAWRSARAPLYQRSCDVAKKRK